MLTKVIYLTNHADGRNTRITVEQDGLTDAHVDALHKHHKNAHISAPKVGHGDVTIATTAELFDGTMDKPGTLKGANPPVVVKTDENGAWQLLDHAVNQAKKLKKA